MQKCRAAWRDPRDLLKIFARLNRRSSHYVPKQSIWARTSMCTVCTDEVSPLRCSLSTRTFPRILSMYRSSLLRHERHHRLERLKYVPKQSRTRASSQVWACLKYLPKQSLEARASSGLSMCKVFWWGAQTPNPWPQGEREDHVPVTAEPAWH